MDNISLLRDRSLSQNMLVKRANAFLDSSDPSWKPLADILALFDQQCLDVCIFGGLLCRLLVLGPSYKPRDVDFVLSGVTTDELVRLFSRYQCQRTRFGGLRVRSGNWSFDLWPASETWALRQGWVKGTGKDFEVLPKTTFLNVEAIAAALGGSPLRISHIYEKGFFDATIKEEIDINLVQNSYPEQAAIRSMFMASQLNYSIGPALMQFIAKIAKRNQLEDLLAVQRDLYGKHPSDEVVLRSWLTAVRQQATPRNRSKFYLPTTHGQEWVRRKLSKPLPSGRTPHHTSYYSHP